MRGKWWAVWSLGLLFLAVGSASAHASDFWYPNLDVEPSDCSRPGEMCAGGIYDGLYFVGWISGNAIYASPADEPGTYRAKTSDTVTPNTFSANDGMANTDAMELEGLPAHPAAHTCRQKGDDWYLPSFDELRLLYELAPGLAFSAAHRYWSSTGHGNGNTQWTKSFLTGTEYAGTSKTSDLRVRCVRR